MVVEAGTCGAGPDARRDDAVLRRLLGDDARRALRDGVAVVARDRGRVDDVFTVGDVEALLTRGRLVPPAVALHRDGVPLAASRWTRSGSRKAEPELDGRSVDDLLASGATLVVRDLRSLLDRVDAVARRLAGELGRAVEAEAGLAVAGPSRTVRVDAAGPDCFVAQVSGSARWTVGAESWSLGAGDVLYVPHGRPRRSETLDATPSVDLLLCVTGTLTWADAFERVVRELAVDDGWRRILPLRPGECVDDVLADLVHHRDELIDLLETLDVEAAAATLASSMTEPEPDRRVPVLRGLGDGALTSSGSETL